MPATKLSFSLRTTPSVKQVHLIGSWDHYQGQLPLSKESGSSKWRGTFRFQQSVMQPGSRYWFYYMLDGYHICHDPTKEFTQEQTTGRNLNILDVPASTSKSSSKSSGSRRSTRELPRGHPAAEIRSPKPVRPGHLARQLEKQVMDQLSDRFASLAYETSSSSESDIDDEYSDSDLPSLTSGSSASGYSSPSSLSSTSSNCTCERYGVTRSGQRVKLDCGGSRCGASSESSSSDEEEQEEYKHRVRASHRAPPDRRRHGVVMR